MNLQQLRSVREAVRQGFNLTLVAEWPLSGEADSGVATEALASYPELVALPCYQWTHSVIVP